MTHAIGSDVGYPVNKNIGRRKQIEVVDLKDKDASVAFLFLVTTGSCSAQDVGWALGERLHARPTLSRRLDQASHGSA